MTYNDLVKPEMEFITEHRYSTMRLSKKSTIVILSHYSHRTLKGGGPPQEIRDHLLSRVKQIAYIEHPFPYADDLRSSLSLYEHGKLTKQIFTPPLAGPAPLFYIADMVISIYFLFLIHTPIDVCIALDPLNTVNMLPFRFMGRVKKLVFYTIDYSRTRFPNKLLNWIYHYMDRLSCRYADVLWNLSPVMNKERLANGIIHIRRTIILPMGANLDRIKPLPISEIRRHQLIYVGHLGEKQGLQCVVEALPNIRKKIPDVKLIVIGTGDYEQMLKTLVHNLKLERHVQFMGFVEHHKAVEKLLCQSAIGIATYKPTPNNYTYFTDPGKPKLYLGCGLPVIITDVPKIAKVIQKHKAGFIVSYRPPYIARTICGLLLNPEKHKQYRNNALALSKKYNTNTLIASAIEKI